MAKVNIAIMNIIFNFISYLNNNNSTVEPLIINYYHTDNRIYSIEKRENNYQILTKQTIYCIKAPCNPIVKSIKKVEDKEDCQILEILFNELFKDSDTKLKNIVHSKSPEEEIDVILDVLENNKIITNLEYKVINNLGEYNSIYRKRGYLYNIEDDSVIYTIAIICYFIQYYYTEKLGIKLNSKNKKDIFSNLIKMHIGFFDNSENAPTKLSDFIITETSNINSSLLHLLLFIELFIGIFISGMIIAGSYSSIIALISLVVFFFFIILNIIFLYLNSKEEELTKDSLYGELLNDNLNNLISLHANNYDDFILSQIDKEIKEKELKKFIYIQI